MSDLPNLSVDSLLAEFGAPKTFEIELPNDAKMTFRGFGSYAEKKAFEKEKQGFVKRLMDAKNSAIKANDNDLLPGPFREHSDLISPENLDAAFTIHKLCIAPGFTPVEAVRLTQATRLIEFVMDQMSWYASNFLVGLKLKLVEDAKKG